MRLQDHRTKYGRQCQGHDAGKNDGRGHRDSKLSVKGPDRPCHECHGNEHRRHHQRDGNDRTADLVHNFLGCLIRRQVLLVHFCVNGFDDHDRIVDDHPDRQHQREKGNQVDRHSEHLQKEKCSDQGYGNSQRRNQCRTDITQEQVDHQ